MLPGGAPRLVHGGHRVSQRPRALRARPWGQRLQTRTQGPAPHPQSLPPDNHHLVQSSETLRGTGFTPILRTRTLRHGGIHSLA